MSSRALTLATVMLLIGCCAAQRAGAQAQNLEAGKTPSQIFSQTCSACHKSPRGLLRTVPPGSLSGFLRQHYTTSPDMAGVLASYLISNGATDPRYAQPKGGREGGREAGRELDATSAGLIDQFDRFGRRLVAPRPPEEIAQPEQSVQGQPGRRSARRLGRPAEHSEDAKPANGPSEPGTARGADDRQLSARQRLTKRGRPAAEEPKAEAPKEGPSAMDPAKDEKAKVEPAKTDAGTSDAANEAGKQPNKDANSQAGKDEDARPERTRPSGEGSSEAAKPERDAAALGPDQVGSVTAAPSRASEAGGSAAASSAPAVTASVPPPPPVTPAGPPTPPISK